MRSTSSSLPNIWLPPSHGPLPPSLAMHRRTALLTPPLTPSSSIRTSTSIDTSATSHHPEDLSVAPLDDDASRFLLLKNVSSSASSTYIDRQLCVALADIRHPAIKGIYKKGQSAGLLILLFYDLRAANHAKAVLSTRHALPHAFLADGYDALVCDFLTLDEVLERCGPSDYLEDMDDSFHVRLDPPPRPDESPDAACNRLMPLLKHLLARYGDIATFAPVADSHDSTATTDADADNAYLVQYFDVNACASAMRSLDQTTFYDATVHISRLTHPSLSLVTSQRDSQRDHARDTPANPTPLPNANLRGISVGLGVGIGIDIDIGGGVGAGMGVCVGIHNVHRHTQSNVHDGALHRRRFMSNFGVAHARSISVDNDTSVDSPSTDISTTSTTTTTTTDITTDLTASTDDDDVVVDSDSPVTHPVNSLPSLSSISPSGPTTSTSPLLPHPNFTFPPTPPMAPLPHPSFFPGPPGPPGLSNLSLTIGGGVGGVGVGPGAGVGASGLMPSPTSTLSSPTSTTAPYYPAMYFTNNYPFPPSPLSPLTPISPHMTTYTYFREGEVVQSSFDGSFHVIVKAGSPSEPPLTMPVSVAMSMGMLVMPMPGLGTPPFIGGGVSGVGGMGGAMGGIGGGIGPGPGPGEVWLGSPPRSIATATTASTNSTNNAANDTSTAAADGIEDQDVGFAYGAHAAAHGHDIDPSTGLPVFYDTATHMPLPAPSVGGVAGTSTGVGGGSRPQSSLSLSATRSLSNRSSPNSLDSYDANSTYATTDNPYAHAHAHHHHLPSGPFNPSTNFTIHPPTNLTLHPPTNLTHPALPIGSAKSSKNNALDIPAIEAGMDTRTTVMIRNIPNKMTDRHLIGYIDSVRPRRIDFLYLRMDFKNGCNVGYAFVNFITVGDLVEFAKAKLGRKWNMFASEKVLEMSYADYQGKEAQVEKFKNSSIMDEREDWRPKIFYSEPGPEQGYPEPFPSPTHLRRKQLSQSNRVGLFPRKP